MDPRGANSGMERVVRGGSWGSFAFQGVAYRNSNEPSYSNWYFGFRVARSSVP